MMSERVAELSLQVEQTKKERDEAASLAVEVQVLRERNFRLSAEEQTIFSLQQKNSELTRSVMELNKSLKDLSAVTSPSKSARTGRNTHTLMYSHSFLELFSD